MMRRNPTILAAAVASLLAMIALTWTPGCSTAAPAQLSATSTPAVKAAASGSTGAASPTGSAADSVHITILHINDSHGHTEPYMLGGKSVGGYARVATMADEARAAGKAARVFLVHAGDEFSRGDDLTRASLGAANVAIMNQLKFDLWVPGNGEFYDGVPVLKARLAESKATVLAANVKIKATDEAIARPYVIEQAGPVHIAFLGLCFLQPLDASFDSYKVAEPLAMARELVPLLRKQADVVILVTHLGAPSDKRLAETVPGIDVILGAHTHNAFPDGNHYKSPEGRDVLTCMAGEHLEYLGKVDLDLARTAGGWQLTSATDVLIPIDGKVKMDPTVTALIAHLAEKYIKPAKSTPSKSAPAPKSPPAAAPVPRG